MRGFGSASAPTVDLDSQDQIRHRLRPLPAASDRVSLLAWRPLRRRRRDRGHGGQRRKTGGALVRRRLQARNVEPGSRLACHDDFLTRRLEPRISLGSHGKFTDGNNGRRGAFDPRSLRRDLNILGTQTRSLQTEYASCALPTTCESAHAGYDLVELIH